MLEERRMRHQTLIIILDNRMGGNYYSGKLSRFEACKGPKRKNCTDLKVSLTDEYTMYFDLRVKENVALTWGRVKTIKNKQDSNGINLQMKKPCDHFFVRQSLKKNLKVTDDCILKKGHYIVSESIKDTYRNYSPTSEYNLGYMEFQVLFIGSQCNVMCFYLNIFTEYSNSTKKG
ncbi:uncharacterized protein LOC113497492 [Trichoplusia ni]|uniref:Uncharacterized protein LOC113497492 n=1 Tax=Trichoplusia ni TaxID=7111 RepID=A0A7E5VX05_TRINI|nr:uncharacterized protein LOC113497492 [Trichoplusia ni]